MTTRLCGMASKTYAPTSGPTTACSEVSSRISRDSPASIDSCRSSRPPGSSHCLRALWASSTRSPTQTTPFTETGHRTASDLDHDLADQLAGLHGRQPLTDPLERQRPIEVRTQPA